MRIVPLTGHSERSSGPSTQEDWEIELAAALSVEGAIVANCTTIAADFRLPHFKKY